MPPTGARITLVFEEAVPDLNGEQLQALLKPMIDFGVKSPAEAFAESLPDFLRTAVQDHRVLVGMDRDMVVYSKGQPNRKVRETGEDGKPFEIWIYGEPPQPVEMIRFQGSFVNRVQLARVGEPIEERTQNEMGDYWGNQPAVAANQHEVKLGDSTDSERTEESAPRAAPTLRKPGEQLPSDNPKNNPAGSMQPVKMPPDQQRPGDPGYSPTVSAKPPQGQGTQQGSGSSSQTNGASTTNSTQPSSAPSPQQKQSDSTDQSNPLDKPQ
jgi:hypothetical protein